MLFIGILLSVWFVIWLYKSSFLEGCSFTIATNDSDNEENDIEPLLEKGDTVYHLSCSECKYDWWSLEPNTNYCPHCGAKLID